MHSCEFEKIKLDIANRIKSENTLSKKRISRKGINGRNSPLYISLRYMLCYLLLYFSYRKFIIQN